MSNFCQTPRNLFAHLSEMARVFVAPEFVDSDFLPKEYPPGTGCHHLDLLQTPGAFCGPSPHLAGLVPTSPGLCDVHACGGLRVFICVTALDWGACAQGWACVPRLPPATHDFMSHPDPHTITQRQHAALEKTGPGAGAGPGQVGGERGRTHSNMHHNFRRLLQMPTMAQRPKLTLWGASKTHFRPLAPLV